MNSTEENIQPADFDMGYFTRRRSIRRFKATDIPDSLISTIVRQSMKAPTTGNMQLYTVIATRVPENRQALARLHFCQPATSAPVMLTVCADFHRFQRWCEINGTACGFGNLQGFLYGLFDATVLAQQITTVAELHGLGTCILGTTAFNAPEIASLLKLPDGVIPLLTIAAGIPDGEGEETERLPLDAILHREEYHDATDEEIAAEYAVKDEFGPNRQYVEENGKPSLAHVFTEVRYPEAMNAEFSGKLGAWLRSQGFNL